MDDEEVYENSSISYGDVPRGEAAWIGEQYVHTGDIDENTRINAEFIFIREAFFRAKWKKWLGITDEAISKMTEAADKFYHLKDLYEWLDILRQGRRGKIKNKKLAAFYYEKKEEVPIWDDLILEHRDWVELTAAVKTEYFMVAGELRMLAIAMFKWLAEIEDKHAYHMTRLRLQNPEKAAKMDKFRKVTGM